MSINLVKGQKINLKKQDGTTLKSVMMGLGWETADNGGFFGGKKDIDLDASVVLFDENKRVVDQVSFTHLISEDGSVRHTGDNRTGAGTGDDEKIYVNLTTVPNNVKSMVFVVNSYSGQKFVDVKSCYCRLVDSVTNDELAIYKLNENGGENTGQIMSKLYLHNGEWKLSALGLPCNGRTIRDVMPDIMAVL